MPLTERERELCMECGHERHLHHAIDGDCQWMMDDENGMEFCHCDCFVEEDAKPA